MSLVVAVAAQLHREVVGRILPDREEHFLALELAAALQHQAANFAAFAADSLDAIRDYRKAEGVELFTILRLVHFGFAAIRADDDVARPRRKVERHAHGAAPVADYHDFLAARTIAVAIGTNVRVRAVGVVQTGNVGPHVAYADGEQHAARRKLSTALETEL